MPWNNVMPKFGAGKLKSGSSNGPKVKNKKQAIAIMMSEKGKAKTKPEYAKTKVSTGPSKKFMSKFGM